MREGERAWCRVGKRLIRCIKKIETKKAKGIRVT